MPDRLPQSGSSDEPDPSLRPAITWYSTEQSPRGARAGVSPARARPPRRPGRLAAILAVVAMLLFTGVVVARQIAAAGASPTSMAQPAAPGTSHQQPPVWDDSGAAPSTGSGSATTTADVAAVAAKVSTAVVNIMVRNGYTSSAGAATGIVLTADGYVLTNNHVIDGATEISAVSLSNGETYPAEVVGYDATQDIALVKLQDASGLATADIGDSSTLAVGDAVIGVGNAGGDGGAPTVAAGVVLALDQQIVASDQSGDAEQLSGLIHTDADIQSGHSGGPLANAGGEVIGVMTAASATDPYHGTASSDIEGFAVPMATAMAIVDQIRSGDESGTVHIGPTAFLGVQTTDAAAPDPYGYGSGQSGSGAGATVAGVVPGSPAEGAGLTAGDVITAVDGAAVPSAEGLGDLIAAYHPGDAVTITWTDSSGAAQSVEVELAEGPAR